MTDAVNSTDLPNLLINGATLIAALSAAYFSHRTIALQGKQRLAEFRKEWIENLRIHLANYRAADFRRKNAKVNMAKFQKNQNKDQNTLWAERYLEFTEESSREFHYVSLCLNEGEPEHSALLVRMRAHQNEDEVEIKKLTDSKAPEFLELARAVLKKEWERLKTEFS